MEQLCKLFCWQFHKIFTFFRIGDWFHSIGIELQENTIRFHSITSPLKRLRHAAYFLLHLLILLNNFKMTQNMYEIFVLIVQGDYARIYYLDSISLIPNWGESTECTAASVPNWDSPLSERNFQRCKISSFNSLSITENFQKLVPDMWRKWGGAEEGVDNVLHLSGAKPMSSSLTVSCFEFLSTTGRWDKLNN